MHQRRDPGRRPPRQRKASDATTTSHPDELPEDEGAEPAAFNFEDWLPPDELAKLYHPEADWHEHVPASSQPAPTTPLQQAAQWWEDEPELKDFFEEGGSWADDPSWVAEAWTDSVVAPPVAAPPPPPPSASPVEEPVVVAKAAAAAVEDIEDVDDVVDDDDEPVDFPPVEDEAPRPAPKFVFLSAATRYAFDDEPIEAAAEVHAMATAQAEADRAEAEVAAAVDAELADLGMSGGESVATLTRKPRAHANRTRVRTGGGGGGAPQMAPPPPPPPPPPPLPPPPPRPAPAPRPEPAPVHVPPRVAAPAEPAKDPVSKRPLLVLAIAGVIGVTGISTQLLLSGSSRGGTDVSAGAEPTTTTRFTTPTTFAVLSDPLPTVPTTVATTTTTVPPTTPTTRPTTTTRAPSTTQPPMVITTLPSTATTLETIVPVTTTTTVPWTYPTYPTTTRPPSTTSTSSTTTTTEPPPAP